MPKRVSEKEESLYEPIMQALKYVFSCLGECYLEKTSDKRFTNKLKRHFSKDTLYIIKVEGFFPDLTGFVKTQYTTDLVTVEVKPKPPSIRDIFQAKEQAEIFDAKYALLVSPKAIVEEIRRFVKDRALILNYLSGRRVVIAQFNETTEEFEIDKELYYGSLPEPFKSHRKAFEAEKLTISPMRFEHKGERGVYVSIVNEGTSPVEIVEIVQSGYPPSARRILLKPGEPSDIQLTKAWLPGWLYKIKLITKNGKKFTLEAQAPQKIKG